MNDHNLPETGDLNDNFESTTYDLSVNSDVDQTDEKKIDIPDIAGDEVLIRLHILGATTPLKLAVKDTVIIGRRDPTAEVTPELDLTPYGGYQMGISRRHAILKFSEKKLFIADAGSRNGTYVDGKRLVPHQLKQIYDGVQLRLGKITLTLYYSKSMYPKSP